jgi:hypothetical protein
MTSPYELLDEVRNAQPSREDMCSAIAEYDTMMAELESLRSVFYMDAKRFLNEYEKQEEIERMYADLPTKYKVMPRRM